MPASRYPRIKIMPQGYLRGQCEPLVMVILMAICLLHQDEFEVQDFLGSDARQRLRVELMKAGRAQPDFDSAWVEWARIGDDDFAGMKS